MLFGRMSKQKLREGKKGEDLKRSSHYTVGITKFQQRSSNNVVPTTQFQQRSSNNVVPTT